LAEKQVDPRMVAATLASALVRPEMSVADAIEIYFECLHAIKAGRRHTEKEKAKSVEQK
jgi:hypothetical protein